MLTSSLVHVTKRVLRRTPSRCLLQPCRFAGNHMCGGTGSWNRQLKVTLIGAVGELGLPLSLLLHQSALIDHLALVDANSLGGGVARLAQELSATDTRATITSHKYQQLGPAVKDAQVVIMAQNAVRKENESRKNRILENAALAAEIAAVIAKHSPQAVVLVATAPVSGVLPVVVGACLRAGMMEARRQVLGVSATAGSRAACMVASLGIDGVGDAQDDPFHLLVPVVGGTSSTASVPLLGCLPANLTQLEKNDVTAGTQAAGSRVLRYRAGADLPALCSAFATARFADAVINAVAGEKGIHEYAFVACDTVPEAKFLSVPVELCRSGVRRVLPLGPLTDSERLQLQDSVRLVQRDVHVADTVMGEVLAAAGPTPE